MYLSTSLSIILNCQIYWHKFVHNIPYYPINSDITSLIPDSGYVLSLARGLSFFLTFSHNQLLIFSVYWFYVFFFPQIFTLIFIISILLTFLDFICSFYSAFLRWKLKSWLEIFSNIGIFHAINFPLSTALAAKHCEILYYHFLF